MSQYLSELDKKHRSNPYSMLKDLQAEHFSLRAHLKDMEQILASKIKTRLQSGPSPPSKPTKPSPKKNISQLQPGNQVSLEDKYKKWLDMHRKMTQLRALVAHVHSTAGARELHLNSLSQNTQSDRKLQTDTSESDLHAALEQSREELMKLKQEYSVNRQLLDSRNKNLLTSGSAETLQNTLKALKTSVQLEEDRYTRVLQESEQLASQLAVNYADVEKLMKLDEDRLKLALDPKSQQLEVQYWTIVSKRSSLDQYVKNLQQQLTE